MSRPNKSGFLEHYFLCFDWNGMHEPQMNYQFISFTGTMSSKLLRQQDRSTQTDTIHQNILTNRSTGK